MASVSKYETKGHRVQVWNQGTQFGVGIDGHARSWYIQQDDAAFYRITSISCLTCAVMSNIEITETEGVGYCERW